MLNRITCIFFSYKTFTTAFHQVSQNYGFSSILTNGILCLLGVETLVLSLFYREVISIGLVAIAMWPLLSSVRRNHLVSLSKFWERFQNLCPFGPQRLSCHFFYEEFRIPQLSKSDFNCSIEGLRWWIGKLVVGNGEDVYVIITSIVKVIHNMVQLWSYTELVWVQSTSQ